MKQTPNKLHLWQQLPSDVMFLNSDWQTIELHVSHRNQPGAVQKNWNWNYSVHMLNYVLKLIHFSTTRQHILFISRLLPSCPSVHWLSTHSWIVYGWIHSKGCPRSTSRFEDNIFSDPNKIKHFNSNTEWQNMSCMKQCNAMHMCEEALWNGLSFLVSQQAV
jgi:hypothetical protein